MSLKKDGIMYVKACVIANGIPDSNNDVLNKKEIKQIYSNSLKIRCDVNHDFVEREGVDILETTITNSDESIKDVLIPAGSWMVIIRILDKDIQELILDGELNGVSITAVPDVAENRSLAGGTMTYKDVKNFDRINPLFISLVGMPCNNLPWEVMNHVQYISKSYVEDENISNEDKIVLSTENFVGILKQLVPTKRKPTQAELTEPATVGDSGDKTKGDVDNMVDTTTLNNNGNDDLQKVLANILERLDKLEQGSGNEVKPVEAIEKAEPVQDLEPQFAKLEADLKTYIKDLLDSYISGDKDGSNKPESEGEAKQAGAQAQGEETTSAKSPAKEGGDVPAGSDKKPEDEEKSAIKKGVHSQKVEFIKKGEDGFKIQSFAEMTGRDPVTFRKL